MQRRAVGRRGRHLGKPELAHVLAFEVLDEIEGFLKRHGVFEPYTPSDFEREQRALDQLGLRGVVTVAVADTGPPHCNWARGLMPVRVDQRLKIMSGMSAAFSEAGVEGSSLTRGV
jgi:hypothetical protein